MESDRLADGVENGTGLWMLDPVVIGLSLSMAGAGIIAGIHIHLLAAVPGAAVGAIVYCAAVEVVRRG